MTSYIFFSECGTDEVQCFLVKQHNFEKDELQTTAQATEKKKKNQRKRLSDLKILDPH